MQSKATISKQLQATAISVGCKARTRRISNKIVLGITMLGMSIRLWAISKRCTWTIAIWFKIRTMGSCPISSPAMSVIPAYMVSSRRATIHCFRIIRMARLGRVMSWSKRQGYSHSWQSKTRGWHLNRIWPQQAMAWLEEATMVDWMPCQQSRAWLQRAPIVARPSAPRWATRPSKSFRTRASRRPSMKAPTAWARSTVTITPNRKQISLISSSWCPEMKRAMMEGWPHTPRSMDQTASSRAYHLHQLSCRKSGKLVEAVNLISSLKVAAILSRVKIRSNHPKTWKEMDHQVKIRQ